MEMGPVGQEERGWHVGVCEQSQALLARAPRLGHLEVHAPLPQHPTDQRLMCGSCFERNVFFKEENFLL